MFHIIQKYLYVCIRKNVENKYLKMYVDMGKYDLSDIFFLYHMPAYEKFGINEEYWFNTLKNIGVE